jgi:2-polyprenyl-6-hydroxyphenyl methylase/3-demethylubiquinone-9 3-methyltransferase
MNTRFYEQYHKSGIGKGSLVQSKGVALNSQKKADFVEKFLKGRVLDVGCGGGFDAAYFKKKGFDVAGCDISRAAVESAKKRFPGTNFFLHNFEERPLKKKYDSVICIDVIEHLFFYREFLRNIYLSLNKGGVLVVSTPNVFGLKSWLRLIKKDGSVFGLGTKDESHIRFFSVKTLGQALQDAGFKVRVLKTFSQSGLWLPGHWNGSVVAVAEK